jgi:hypothetical protein
VTSPSCSNEQVNQIHPPLAVIQKSGAEGGIFVHLRPAKPLNAGELAKKVGAIA